MRERSYRRQTFGLEMSQLAWWAVASASYLCGTTFDFGVILFSPNSHLPKLKLLLWERRPKLDHCIPKLVFLSELVSNLSRKLKTKKFYWKWLSILKGSITAAADLGVPRKETIIFLRLRNFLSCNPSPDIFNKILLTLCSHSLQNTKTTCTAQIIEIALVNCCYVGSFNGINLCMTSPSFDLDTFFLLLLLFNLVIGYDDIFSQFTAW